MTGSLSIILESVGGLGGVQGCPGPYIMQLCLFLVLVHACPSNRVELVSG